MYNSWFSKLRDSTFISDIFGEIRFCLKRSKTSLLMKCMQTDPPLLFIFFRWQRTSKSFKKALIERGQILRLLSCLCWRDSCRKLLRPVESRWIKTKTSSQILNRCKRDALTKGWKRETKKKLSRGKKYTTVDNTMLENRMTHMCNVPNKYLKQYGRCLCFVNKSVKLETMYTPA